MKDDIKIRSPRSGTQKLHCVLCGSTVDVERHHAGGQYHIGWFNIPLCRMHHVRLTALIRLAGVNMSYTPDIRERFARARMMIFVFLWLLDEALKEYEQKQKEKQR